MDIFMPIAIVENVCKYFEKLHSNAVLQNRNNSIDLRYVEIIYLNTTGIRNKKYILSPKTVSYVIAINREILLFSNNVI